MTNNNNFPNTEPPPHPGENVTTPNPMDVMVPGSVNNAESTVSGPASPAGTPQQDITGLPKKGIPKILILVVVGILTLGGIVGAIIAYRSGGTDKLVSTKGEIKWWSMEDPAVVMPLIDEFERQNPNVRVIYERQSEKDYRERLTNALAAGKGPDIFEIHNSWVPMFKNDISEMPESVLSKSDYAKNFYPVATKNFTGSKGMLAIPLEYDAITLFINDDIFTAALKSEPKTWDETRTLAKQMTQRGPGNIILQSGASLGITDNVDHWPEIIALMLLQNGVNLDKPSVSETKDALTYYARFYSAERTWDEKLPTSTVAFTRGKVAMYFGPTKRAQEIVNDGPSLKFRTVLLPQLPKENPGDPDISYATYWAQTVWKKSNNAELSWNFLKFLSSAGSLQKLNGQRRSLNLLEKAYPRSEMAILQKDDKILGSIVALAPYSKSWYLHQNTNDGLTGINSQINKIYEQTLEAAMGRGDLENLVRGLAAKNNAVLSKYNSKK